MSIDELKERFLASISTVGGTLRVRNALNPILWLAGIVVPPCLFILGFAQNPPAVVSHILYAVVGVALFGFLFLLACDRDRLQSEEFLIRQQTLDLIEEKGSKQAISAATVPVLSQQQFLELPQEASERQLPPPDVDGGAE